MHKFIITIALLFPALSLAALGKAQPINLVVVKVNERAITSYEVAKRYHAVIKTSGFKTVSKRDQGLLLSQIIYKMINEELILQEATKLGIDVTSEEMNDESENSPSSFDYNQLRSNILWSKIVSQIITPKIRVKDSEVRELIEQEKLNYKINKFLTAELFLTNERGDTNSNKKTRELADKLVKELRSGADFKKLVEQFSSETGSEGELGWITKDDIDPRVYRAVSSLQLGAYSNPIKLNDGYHIFKLLNKKTEIAVKPQNLAIARTLLLKRKVQTAARGYMLDLHRNSFVEINMRNLVMPN